MKEDLYNIYTSKQEYSPMLKDKFDRILSYSIQRDSFFDPAVSKYISDKGLKPVYPDNKNFAVVLSHDIDLLYINKSKSQAIKNVAKSVLKNDDTLLRNSFKSIIHKTIFPEYQISNILDLEKKHKAKSTFFFLALDNKNSSFNYEIGEQKDVLKEIIESGNEIALHGSYEAYSNIDLINREKTRLENAAEKEVVGYRNHNLNFDIRTTFSLLEKANFKYDATFGLADRAGFRNGMCHPFNPFDLPSGTFYKLVSMPLHVMDVSLFKYMNLNFKQAFDLFQIISKKVKDTNGVLSFLWHNNYMVGEMKEFYEECLSFLEAEGAYFDTHQNILKLYQEQGLFEKIKESLL